LSEIVLVAFDLVYLHLASAFLKEMNEHDGENICIVWLVARELLFASDAVNLFDRRGAINKPSEFASMFESPPATLLLAEQ
jgi:hypothetical protein